MGHLLLPVDRLDLVECVDVWTEAAVHAENLLVHDGRQGQEVHNLRAVAPHVDRAILAHALVIKPVHLRDLARLVIAPDQCDILRIAHLQRQEQKKGLNTIKAAIDKVTHEQIIGPRTVVADAE